MENKLCSKCGIEKSLNNFYYDKSKTDKRHPECKSCFNQRMKETRKMSAFKFRFNPYQKEWHRTYRRTEKYKKWRRVELTKQSIKARELKREIVNHYGGKCACCGITEIAFLTIDHINNDGYKLRQANGQRLSGYFFYKKIIKENYPNDLQILCFNCNIARQHNGGVCPHKS